MSRVPLVLPVDEASHVGDARRRAVRFAEEIGLEAAALDHLGLLINELATNLVKHAREGQLILQGDGDGGLEVLALDRGPGMYDVERCFEDGFSTAGSRGMGLSAIRRLASQSDIYSKVDSGTVHLVRLGNGKSFDASRLLYRVRGVSVPYPGETVCGDAWATIVSPKKMAIIVAEGLVHGLAANDASSAAVRVFLTLEGQAPGRMLDEIHQALKATRGAAVSIASIDLESREVTYAGIGNVVGLIASPDKIQRMVSINGTLGCASPKPREFTYALPAGAVVVLYSDGLLTQTGLAAYPGLINRDPALVAAALYRDFKRGKDDATVVVAAT